MDIYLRHVTTKSTVICQVCHRMSAPVTYHMGFAFVKKVCTFCVGSPNSSKLSEIRSLLGGTSISSMRWAFIFSILLNRGICEALSLLRFHTGKRKSLRQCILQHIPRPNFMMISEYASSEYCVKCNTCCRTPFESNRFECPFTQHQNTMKSFFSFLCCLCGATERRYIYIYLFDWWMHSSGHHVFVVVVVA